MTRSASFHLPYQAAPGAFVTPISGASSYAGTWPVVHILSKVPNHPQDDCRARHE